MSLTEKQTIYSLQSTDDCLSSELNGGDENLNLEDDNRQSNEGVRLRNCLRNGLRSYNKNRNDLSNSTPALGTKKLINSLFNQLTEEAKTIPVSDFELAFESSSLFIPYEKQSLTNGLKANLTNNVQIHTQSIQQSDLTKLDTTINDINDCKKKANRRKNQIEFIEDFDDQFELDFSVSNSMHGKSASLRDSQGNSSLKELRNFKNHPNDLNLSNPATSRQESKRNVRPQVKPIQRIFIDDNMFKYNEGLVSADKVNTSKIVLKKIRKRNTLRIFEQMNSKRLSLELNQEPNFRESTQSINKLDKLTETNQLDSMRRNSHSLDEKLHQLMNNCLLFSSTNKSPVFDLYTFQEKNSPNLERDDCQTSIVALIQLEQISIWTKEEPSQIEWTKHYYKLDENQQVFRCCKIDRENCVCLLFLVCSHSLVSLKYCLIDKSTKNCQLVHGETFEVSNIDLNLIHLCFVNPKYIALSIPRIDDNIIDVLIYDQFDFQSQFNKSKRIIYMLNNVDNKFSSMTNCFLASDELDNTFLAIFNQKLFMCNVNEYNKLPKMISLQKYADSDYSYFDVLYDKGIFYIFAGNYASNTVRIIALNIDRCLADKLMKYDLEKCLEEDRLNNDEMDIHSDEQSDEFIDDERTVRLFKRKGDHLLVIKNDNTVALFNMFSDEIVYQTRLLNVDQAAIAVLNQKTTILAVLDGNIVNLVDL